jgi:hypothetical protein
VATGSVSANGQSLSAGDGVAIADLSDLSITGHGEVMLFDLN